MSLSGLLLNIYNQYTQALQIWPIAKYKQASHVV